MGIVIVPLFTLPTRSAGKARWSLTNESQAADEILVVRDGAIVEHGQHRDLVQAGGVYQELYETQFSKAFVPQEDGVSELEQYIWGTQPADEP